jgi:hypothetical protein
MDPTYIGLDIGLLLAIIYILEPNLPYYLKLKISEQIINSRLRIYQGVFRIRLWYDKQSLRPGPVGRFLRDQQLRGIRNNPAYREFFRD